MLSRKSKDLYYQPLFICNIVINIIKELPTTLSIKVLLLSDKETICEYFLPPSPQPPTANSNFNPGYLYRKSVKFLNPC